MKIDRPYIQRGQFLPDVIIDSLERYVNDRVQTGSFLRAALENDFKKAATKCDHININCLTALALCITNELPTACHGSPDKVAAWLNPKKPTIQHYSNEVIESLIDETYDAKHAVSLVEKYATEITILFLKKVNPDRTASLVMFMEKSPRLGKKK